MIRYLIFFVFIYSISGAFCMAQNDYKNAVGVRVGPSGGMTYKTTFRNNKSVEVLLTTRWGALMGTGLFQLSQDVFSIDRLNFYYGLGGHVGLWNGEKDQAWFDHDDTELMIGLDGIIGIGYTFEKIPFEISLDWKPLFNIAAYTDFWVEDGAFSVRYIIN